MSRIRSSIYLNLVKVVSTRGNQKAKSVGMGRDFPCFIFYYCCIYIRCVQSKAQQVFPPRKTEIRGKREARRTEHARRYSRERERGRHDGNIIARRRSVDVVVDGTRRRRDDGGRGCVLFAIFFKAEVRQFGRRAIPSKPWVIIRSCTPSIISISPCWSDLRVTLATLQTRVP